MSDIAIVYATFPDEGTAKRIAHIVVNEKLAACANILGSITSIYEWEGKVEENEEISALFKTTTTIMPVLIARLSEWHPYDVPALLGWPISEAPAPFTEWVKTQTKI